MRIILLRHGGTSLPRSFAAEVLAKFPNDGFHRQLVELTMQRMKKLPFSPLPMMKR